MKKTITTILLFLAFSFGMQAQNIEMELYLSTPDIQGSDVGDSHFLDIDNDGDMDLILSGRNGVTRTTIYRNDGEGNFTEDTEEILVDVGTSEIESNDVDNDGDLDLFIVGRTHGGNSIANLYINDGTGTFSVATNSTFANTSGSSIAFGDIDSDGDDDLIYSGVADNTSEHITVVYSNNGQGVFTEISIPIFNGLVGRYEIFDLDSDGDNDVIFSGVNVDDETKTHLFSNDGSGNFTLLTNTGLGDFTSGDIAIGDTDNDGDLDVLLCGYDLTSEAITQLFINDGDGNFTLLEGTIFKDATLGEASFNDFDNDGDLDLFTIGTGNGGLVGEDGENTILGIFYQNEGDNNFVNVQEIIGAYLSHHAVGDIDGNGTLDLVLGGTTTGDPTRGSFMYKNVTEIVLGTEDVTLTNDFLVYPNPAQNKINLETTNSQEGTIEIYSTLGQLVHKTKVTASNTQLDLNLSEGTYFINLNTADSNQVKKLIIGK